MKVRNGFVSNSSSSSFLIVGYQVTHKEAKELIKNNPDTNIVFVSREDINMGKDVVENLTKSQIEIVRNNLSNNEYTLYHSFYTKQQIEYGDTKIDDKTFDKLVKENKQYSDSIKKIIVEKDKLSNEDPKEFIQYYTKEG